MNNKKFVVGGLGLLVILTMVSACGGGGTSTTEPVATLTGIEVASGSQTSFTVGDEFVKPIVNAKYSNQSTKVVSDQCTYSGFSSAKVGSCEVSVSYTEGSITKDCKYTVTIEDVKSALKFAIFADVQLCNDTEIAGEAAANLGATANAPIALKNHLEYCKANQISTILLNGDITNQANTHYYDYFYRIFESVYGKDETTYPELVWNMGNHEWWGGTTESESAEAVTMFKQNARIDSKYLVKKSAVKFPLKDTETVPSYYKVINGVPIMVISGINSNGEVPADLQTEVKSWLAEIKELDSVKKGGPIFVQYHYALNTSMTHGQAAGKYADTIESIFADTPNAVIFTGDTHFPGNNERSINQKDFTTINLGSSSYSRMVNQSAVICDDYYNVEGTGTKTGDKLVGNAKFKEAYTPSIQVVDVKVDSSFTIDRYFSEEGGKAHSVGQQWKFSPIKTKDDFKYTDARFQNKDAAKALYGAEGLSWEANDEVIYNVNEAEQIMTVRFPDVKDYHYAEHYLIKVNDSEYDVVSNYYKYLDSIENNYYILKDVPKADTYTVKVTAYDFYDNPSLNSLTATAPTANAGVDPIDYQSTLTYCDIQTRNNFDQKADESSNSSVEYYYEGIQTYKAGAIASRLIQKGGTDCSKYVTLQDDNECEPTVVATVKNINDCNVNVGLSIVKDNNGTEEWKDDFGKSKKSVAPGEWTQLVWKLKDYEITKKSQISNITLKFNSDGATSDGYKMGLLVDNIDLLPKAPRQLTRFEAAEDHILDLSAPVSLKEKFTIDLKLDKDDEGSKVAVALLDDWENYFGYFDLKQSGATGDTGVSSIKLDDGFVRYTFDLSKLTSKIGNPQEVNIFYIRKGSGEEIWTTVGGVYEIQESHRGEQFVAGKNLSLKLPKALDTSTDKLTIDFKITTDSSTHASVMFYNENSWDNCIGYFNIYKTAKLINDKKYTGVIATDLDDGFVRVVFDLNAITSIIGTKPETITHVHVRGNWTDASGYIDVSPTE